MDRPVLAISHGAGIAPFLAFEPTSEFVLFFGCRTYDDFLYE